VEHHLGVAPQKGGVHDGAGTHNMLLGLGPHAYLEVIAPDPDQPDPPHPRLFDLDDPATRTALEAGPTLVGWVARVPALEALVARLGPRGGDLREMRRGDLHWRMAVPPPRQDMDNLIPALIEWKGERASKRLKDSHVRIASVEAEHPDSEALARALRERGLEEVLKPRRGMHPRLLVRLTKADGSEVSLSSG
jgi:hypothetical protein